ncbi:hypothetical protein MPSEU_001030700 [Mayamaea pseudoterrestris]|nr:hypothetical protein MPSEU_001030700 [Mayamaea pseudoterrestris]
MPSGRGHLHLAEGDADRAEQKRQRERQRRSNLAHAFEELREVLDQVDESHVSPGDELAARADTITRASRTLRRLVRENMELKVAVAGGASTINPERMLRMAKTDTSDNQLPTTDPLLTNAMSSFGTGSTTNAAHAAFATAYDFKETSQHVLPLDQMSIQSLVSSTHTNAQQPWEMAQANVASNPYAMSHSSQEYEPNAIPGLDAAAWKPIDPSSMFLVPNPRIPDNHFSHQNLPPDIKLPDEGAQSRQEL